MTARRRPDLQRATPPQTNSVDGLRDGREERRLQGFFAGATIGTLGGLIGLGGAEFRLPVLVGVFRLATLDAVVFNKAVSLVVVGAALLFRGAAIPLGELVRHLDVVGNLLAGSVVGAWLAAGRAAHLDRAWLDRIVMLLLMSLSLIMFYEAWAGVEHAGVPLIESWWLRVAAGLVAGLGIGIVAGLLGVAGGELLIPTIVLLFGLDIKLAGSLSLMVSLPTISVGLVRYALAGATATLRREPTLLRWMVAGSIAGAGLGGSLLGGVPSDLLMGVLAIVLFVSAVKIFRHGD